MGYVRKVLVEGEKVTFTTTLHRTVYVTPVLGVVLSLVLLAWWHVGDLRQSYVVGGVVLGGRHDHAKLAAAGFVAFVSAFMFVDAWLKRFSTEIAVTDRRVIAKYGLWRRRATEIPLSKVESVDVEQSVPGRMMDYGTVVVRGTGGGLEPMRRVGRPFDLKAAVLAH